MEQACPYPSLHVGGQSPCGEGDTDLSDKLKPSWCWQPHLGPLGAGTVSSVTTQQESDSEEWLWLSHDDQTEERNEPEGMEVLEMSMSISQLSEMGKAAVWFRNLPTAPGSSLVPSEELCGGKGFLAHTMPAE